MKKYLLILILFLVGCSSKSSIKIQNNKYVIDIPTASSTGALYPLGYSLGKIWNENIENIRVNIQSSGGGIDNLNLIYDNDATLSLGVSSIVYEAYNGLDMFKGRENKNLRIIAGLYLNPNQVIVKKQINTLNDLKNTRFSQGSLGSTTEIETKLHLKAAGLDIKDLKLENISPSESSDMIRNGGLDGIWIMAGVGAASVMEITSSTDTKVLNIDEDTFNNLKKDYPWYVRYKIPKGTYKNQKDDIYTTAIKMIIYTTKDLPDDIVYKLTKTMWENIDILKETNKVLKDVKLEDAIKDIGEVPLAKGAEKYYREVGIIK